MSERSPGGGTRHLSAVLCALLVAGCGGGAPTAGPQPARAGAGAAGSGASRTTLVVFAAGSLIVPFGDVVTAFEAVHPEIDVQAQYHGSIQVMRHVSELHEEVDLTATADSSLIPLLLYGETDPATGRPYADWYISFASNRLAIAYSPKSKYASEINTGNWYEILSRNDVRVGMSDPRFDAVGYRTLMLYGLAGSYYDKPSIFGDMFNGRFTTPVTIFREDSGATVTVPEVLETKSDTGLVMRGDSSMLIPLLQTGDLDYAFEYESVIQQHGLQKVSLPDALNLGAENADYSKVVVDLDFHRFATVRPEFRGERIGYGLTIPTNAPHPKEAELFVQFLLGPEGRAIMTRDDHPLFDPALCNGAVPPALRTLCA
jgi:molybdate/tungstate transport system substrate-binding protein